MMTQAEIDALPDAELERLCAERIIGWTVNESGMYCNDRCVAFWPSDPWNPLNDWNHCYMVIDAMRAKQWRLSMNDQQASVMFSASNAPTTYGYFSREAKYEPAGAASQRKAVLRAALAAMQNEPDQSPVEGAT